MVLSFIYYNSYSIIKMKHGKKNTTVILFNIFQMDLFIFIYTHSHTLYY